jgi:hypothetical protein
MKSILGKIRGSYLKTINTLRVRSSLRTNITKTAPIFVIVSPRDFHLTPCFTAGLVDQFCVYLVANGLSPAMLSWLNSHLNGQVVIHLAASISGNAETFLQHAEVVDLIASNFTGNFFICDADCLVTDYSWLLKHSSLEEGSFALGPFGKDTIIPNVRMPDTFLVLLNSEVYSKVTKEYGIDASICSNLNNAVRKEIISRFGQDVFVPEPGKSYVDTLQHFWMAALASGLKFTEITGAGRNAFHVGGSSYLLHGAVHDLTYWDCWPANTIYINLKFIECLNDSFIMGFHRHLFDKYGDSESFLESVPQLRSSWRFSESCEMINFLFGLRNV